MSLAIKTRRSWVEIDLNQIVENCNIYKEHLPNGAQIIAVVKADAYGHGDVRVAQILQRNGINYFAVSNIDEGVKLRISGIEGEILILGYTPKENFEDLSKFDLTQTLLSCEYADLAVASGFDFKCQFAIDTGMNRIGLDGDDPKECERIIREYNGKLNINGVFTHLSSADLSDEDSVEFTKEQIAKFDKIEKLISDLNFPYVHCMNSAGGIYHGGKKLVRLGIVLYGLKFNYKKALPDGIVPALTWKTVVSMVKKIKRGESVGYGRTFVAKREMWLATLSVGYADGYRRDLSNRGYVLFDGEKLPIVGRVCMDQMTVDISALIEKGKEIQIGDEVILLGQSGNESFTADDMAKTVGTIGHDILCGISSRVERVYL